MQATQYSGQLTDVSLEKHIRNGKIAPSYLLADKDILKLREIAAWFEKAGGFISADVFWLVPETDTDTIQVKGTEAFIEKASFAAVGERKLLIVCDISTMTVAAQNKLLKTVEEAAAGTHFLLLASNSETVLNTIKSRCITVYPKPLSAEEITKRFPGMPPEFSDGTLGGAAAFVGNPNSSSIYRNVEQLLSEVNTLDEALTLVPLLTAKENFRLSLSALNFYLGKLLHSSVAGSAPELGGNARAARWTTSRVNAIIKMLSVINRNTAANCNAQNAFDLLLIELFNQEAAD